MIRHGQASFGARNYDRLSPIGIRQAQITADHLAALNIHFDAIYCGDMKRQKDTARPLLEKHPSPLSQGDRHRILPAFDEYDARAILLARKEVSKRTHGSAVVDLTKLRRDRKAFQVYFNQTVSRWLEGAYDDQAGIEPWDDFCGRVRDGIAHLVKEHGRGCRIALFTSGGPISVAMQMALNLSPRKTLDVSWQVMNASITCFKYNPSGITLSMFNNITGLLLQKDPELLTYR